MGTLPPPPLVDAQQSVRDHLYPVRDEFALLERLLKKAERVQERWFPITRVATGRQRRKGRQQGRRQCVTHS